MKKCNNCGAQLADDARFCSQCGAKQADTPRQAASPSNRDVRWNTNDMSKEDLIAKLKNSLPLLEEAQEYQKDLLRCQRQLETAKRLSGIRTTTRPLWDFSMKADHLFERATFGVFKRTEQCIDNMTKKVLPGAERLMNGPKLSRIYDDDFDEVACQARYDEALKVLNRFAFDHLEHFSFIPDDYRYPLAVEYFIKYLEQGRAQSMGEALNLYDEQTHRWTMEDAQSRMIRNQKEMMFQLDLISLSM